MLVAGIGVLIQIIAGYANYRYFTGKNEERLRNLGDDVLELKASRAKMWENITSTASDVAYLRGRIDERKANGATAR